MSAALDGKRIMVTRARDQADELIALLQNAGASVLHLPVIEFAPPASWQACDAALDRISDYDWLVFSSANGVRFFLQRLHERAMKRDRLQTSKIAAVGEKTTEILRQSGLEVDLVPDLYQAEGLVAALAEHELHDSRILVVRPEKTRDVLAAHLRKHGAQVDEAVVYQNRPASVHDAKVDHLLNGAGVDVVMFTSPSTVRNLAAAIGDEKLRSWNRDGCKVAVIGRVTAKAAEKLGLAVDIVPDKSTVADFVESIIEYYSR